MATLVFMACLQTPSDKANDPNKEKGKYKKMFSIPPFTSLFSPLSFLFWRRLEAKGLSGFAREEHAVDIKSNFDLISFYLFMICVTRLLSWPNKASRCSCRVTGHWINYRHDLDFMFNTFWSQELQPCLMISSRKPAQKASQHMFASSLPVFLQHRPIKSNFMWSILPAWHFSFFFSLFRLCQRLEVKCKSKSTSHRWNTLSRVCTPNAWFLLC